MILHILDLKQYMYTGVSKPQTVVRGVIEDSGCYRPREFRCGSLAYLIDEIYRILKVDGNSICFCVDTTPTIKRELSERVIKRQYKGGRTKAPSHVTYQFDFAIKMVKEIGFNTVMIDGYEADDCIASVVRKYNHMYEKIVIHTNDSDQYYLISEKVSIVPTSLKGKNINRDNYEQLANKKRYTPYNTITLSKLIWGEPTDNIPSLNDEAVDKIKKLIPREINPYLGDNELLRTIIKNLCGNDEYTMTVFDLIAPMEVLDNRVVVEPGIVINHEMLRYFGIEFQSYACQRFNSFPYSLGEEMIEDYLNYLEDKGVI